MKRSKPLPTTAMDDFQQAQDTLSGRDDILDKLRAHNHISWGGEERRVRQVPPVDIPQRTRESDQKEQPVFDGPGALCAVILLGAGICIGGGLVGLAWLIWG